MRRTKAKKAPTDTIVPIANASELYSPDQFVEEQKNDGFKFNLSRRDIELFDEKRAQVANPVIRVRRLGMINKNERWRIFQDEELMFVIEGIKLLKKEAAFLRTVEGVNFLISEFKKEPFQTMSELKIRFKSIL